MKTLEDLKRLKAQAQSKVDMRQTKDGYRVSIGMATCGIAAGARPILTAFVEEVSRFQLNNVTITQVGCIGECALEPIVEVQDFEGNKTTYVHVTKELVDQIVKDHLMNHHPLEHHTLFHHKK